METSSCLCCLLNVLGRHFNKTVHVSGVWPITHLRIALRAGRSCCSEVCCPPPPAPACLGRCLRTSLQALPCPAHPCSAVSQPVGLLVLLSLFTSHLP